MTDESRTGEPVSPAEPRVHTMPGQRVVNVLVRGLLRTPGPAGIRFKGKRRWADVQVAEAEPDVVSAYAHMARVNPTFAKFNSISTSVRTASQSATTSIWHGLAGHEQSG